MKWTWFENWIKWSHETEMAENTSAETQCCTKDSDEKEIIANSDACEPMETASIDSELNPDVCEKMDQVFSNPLIRSEIVAKMGMKERLTVKSVCSGFLETLSRKKFLRKEFIAFREKFSSEEVEKLKPLGLLQREDVNLSFIDVKSFIDGPKDFWMRWNVKKVRFKGCCINFKLLQQVIENSKNPLEISAIECSFDDSSGWKSRPLAEYDPLLPILESENTPNPKIEKGKIIFHKNVEPYVKRFYDSCNYMFVYCDKGIVQTFVFEFKHHSHYIAFAGWNVQDVINIYNDVQLDASPKKLLGWSTFRSYLKTRDVDQKADPRWVMIDRNTKHVTIYPKEPRVIVYSKE